jgi:hypothetical protein
LQHLRDRNMLTLHASVINNMTNSASAKAK